MAKIVLAGSADCPYYARNEILADSLVKNLPGFKLHKIVKQPEDWEKWLADTCAARKWKHIKSPIIWRELVDRGGKGMLIGGSNEFQEYCNTFYGVRCNFTSDDMLKVAQENLQTKLEMDQEETNLRAQSKPIKVAITNATRGTAYGIVNYIAQGDVLGNGIEMELHLLDTVDKTDLLTGLKMECEDLAYRLLRKVVITTDQIEAFKNCAIVIFLDELDQVEEEPEDVWLKRNGELFASYGHSLNVSVSPDVKVLVAGSGPVNFNANILIHNTISIHKKNIVALARNVESHAMAILAQRLNVKTSDIINAIIWGNVNGTNIADVSMARVHHYEGAITGPHWFTVPANEMVHNDKWVEVDFVELLQKWSKPTETSSVSNSSGKPSLSMAAAVIDTLEAWLHGRPSEEMYSLGVYSEGDYGIPSGIVYSLPVQFKGKGDWAVVQGLNINEEQLLNMNNIAEEMILEKELVYPNLTRKSNLKDKKESETIKSNEIETLLTANKSSSSDLDWGTDKTTIGDSNTILLPSEKSDKERSERLTTQSSEDRVFGGMPEKE